jgi:hypothetical protein
MKTNFTCPPPREQTYRNKVEEYEYPMPRKQTYLDEVEEYECPMPREQKEKIRYGKNN